MNEFSIINNYDNNFLRIVSIGLAKTFNKSIRWINYFEEKNTKMRVIVPFYLSLVGEENFVLDTFSDDIVGKRVQLNTDQITRGVITIKNISTRSSDFANPNQYLSQKAKINSELRKIISKVKAVPVTINYEIKITCENNRDLGTCWAKIQDTIFNYMFFRFEYFGLPIDGFFKLPDDNSIEFPTEINMESQNNRFPLTFNLDIKTYYPIFQVNTDDLEVCDNDNEIDWNYLGVPQPTHDFKKSIIAYYKSHDQEYSDFAINRVFWKTYLYRLNEFGQVEKPTKSDGTPDVKNWKQENI
jgi:hypothetical protein